jgi:hypothetical protein
MLTLFTTAKPFHGHSGIIQRNALQSWRLLDPGVEVIVFGDEEGTAEVSADLGLRHEPRVERHESGMKYLNYIFERAQAIAKHPYLCYSNCDIVLLRDFRRAFEKAVAWRASFLMVAQRWDADVTNLIDFNDSEWQKKLRQLALATGHQQIPQYVDFFTFRKGLYDPIPALLNGRSHWDHWLVWKALSCGVPVLDASQYVFPVHQNHNHGYHPLGKKGTNEDDLAMRNIHVAGGPDHLRCIIHSTHRITRYGNIQRIGTWVDSGPVLRARQSLLNVTFPLRRRLGRRWPALNRVLRTKDPLA